MQWPQKTLVPATVSRPESGADNLCRTPKKRVEIDLPRVAILKKGNEYTENTSTYALFDHKIALILYKLLLSSLKRRITFLMQGIAVQHQTSLTYLSHSIVFTPQTILGALAVEVGLLCCNALCHSWWELLALWGFAEHRAHVKTLFWAIC